MVQHRFVLGQLRKNRRQAGGRRGIAGSRSLPHPASLGHTRFARRAVPGVHGNVDILRWCQDRTTTQAFRAECGPCSRWPP
jgi:hypothetical protein